MPSSKDLVMTGSRRLKWPFMMNQRGVSRDVCMLCAYTESFVERQTGELERSGVDEGRRPKG
jgi:hypothetical protein